MDLYHSVRILYYRSAAWCERPSTHEVLDVGEQDFYSRLTAVILKSDIRRSNGEIRQEHSQVVSVKSQGSKDRSSPHLRTPITGQEKANGNSTFYPTQSML